MHRKTIVRAAVLFGVVLFGALFLSVIMPPAREAGQVERPGEELVRVAPQVALGAPPYSCDNGDPLELEDWWLDACPVGASGGTYLDQHLWFLQNAGPPNIYDIDWFSFWLEDGATLDVDVTAFPNPPGSDFNIYLWDSAGVEVDSDTTTSADASISYLSTFSQTYYLGIENITETVNGCYPPGTPCVQPATDWQYHLTITIVQPAPAAPTGLTATAASQTQIDLSWTDNSSNESNFRIERSPDGATWAEIGSVGANTTAYSDSGLACGTQYYYRVRAYRSSDGLYSGYSNTANATTLACNTPTPTSTGTAAPTSTGVPTPTLTPTPDMGNPPDIAEPNNDFYNSFRIAPGNSINLNFNSGIYGVEDVDFFAMTVKEGVTYTCETSDLGIGTDTILTVYGPDTSFDNQLCYNDDIDSLKGNVASRVTWKSEYNGQAYMVVRQNGPLAVPGLATYTLTCYTGQPKTSLPSGGGGGGGAPAAPGPKSAIKIEIVDVPTRVPVPTTAPPGTLTVKLVIAYDENANGIIDLSEGVMGMSVRAISPSTNRQLASGFTDQYGSLQLIVAAPENSEVLVVVPFLSIGKMFRVGQVAEWQVRLPAANLPGLIP